MAPPDQLRAAAWAIAGLRGICRSRKQVAVFAGEKSCLAAVSGIALIRGLRRTLTTEGDRVTQTED